ncbi:MAG: amidohydrolase family protein [Deltaproteobacteria bacterium]|nr:amidohydrolase family protein [Deltaproteobacteria bacterium]
MAHDLVIRNGMVIDGTGSPGYEADVAIDGEEIAVIGKNLGSGKKEIDAKGHVVDPGFIDAHTHMDAFVVQYPNGNPVVNYGVTSIVIGDCGASCAPVPPKPEPRQVLVQYLRRVLDKYVDDKDWRWNTFAEYLDYIEGKISVNVLPLMPHSPVRLTVMGEAAYQREANAEELAAMKKMVREGMELGAIGFSTSPRGGPAIHAGTPSTFATHDEIIELASVAADYNGCFQFNGFQMMLQPDTGVPAMLEKIRCLQIGNEFRQRPGQKADATRAIAFMREALKRGQEVYGVVIPYTHIRRFTIDDCFFLNGLPTWEAIKNSGNLKSPLQDKEARKNLERERIAAAGKPEFAEWHGWGRVVFEHIEKPELKKLEGKNVEEIARLTEKPAVDAFFDTWLEDDLKSQCVYHGLANAHQELLAEMIKSDTSLIGTDVGAHLDRFFWHGAPTKVLGYWRREKGLFNLEQAVHKLTGFPAEKLRLNRGLLKEGMPADVTVFDADKIDDLVSKKLPDIIDAQEVKRHPPGMKAVVVNGATVVEDGHCNDVFPGKVRRQQLCRAQ